MLTGTLGVWKTVSASPNSRNLSALVAHPNAPLLATGTASQVGFHAVLCSGLAAPLWYDAGERITSHYLDHAHGASVLPS